MLNDAEREEMNLILSDLLKNETVKSMKNYIQHGTVTTFDHVLSVAERCFEMSRRHPDVDRKKLLRAALLHDFYLYDWHDPDPSHKWHGFHHARRAANNAKEMFHLSDEEVRMIDCHMWPLNPERIPKTRSEWILTLADKEVSFIETVKGFAGKVSRKEKIGESSDRS